jgi:cell division inhibitor SepF
MWQKTMVYLGLKDDEEGYEYDYDELALDDEPGDEAYAQYEPEPAERPARTREPVGVAAQPRTAQPRVRAVPVDEVPPVRDATVPAIRPMPATSARVHVVEPHGFNDAQEVGDRLENGQPVILNLQGVDRDLQRRLIDFSSGLAYALSGTMSKAADQVFLLTPSNVEVSDEEKERLQARGLYRASHI